MKDLNKLRDEAYAIAKEHGWYDEEHSEAHYKNLVISELMEAVQQDRDDNSANIEAFNAARNFIKKGVNVTPPFKELFDIFIKDTVEDELADACIRLLSYAGHIGLELPQLTNTTGLYEGMRFTEAVYAIISEVQASTTSGLIAIIRYCKTLGIDIFKHIELKMEYNKTRPYKHGKKY